MFFKLKNVLNLKYMETKPASHDGSPNPNIFPVWKICPFPNSNSPEYINSVAISGDGSVVIAGTYYYDYKLAGHMQPTVPTFTVGVFAYNNNGTQLWSDEFLATEGVYWVAVSRDGNWAASGGLALTNQGFISVYDAHSGAKVLDYQTTQRTNWVTFNADGSVLVAAAANILYVFSRGANGWNPTPQTIALQPQDWMVSCAISGDGCWIAAGSGTGTVMLIQNTGGVLSAPVYWKFPSPGGIHWVEVAFGGSAFVAGGADGNVYYFNIPGFLTNPSPAWIGALTGCKSCRSVAISDDGTAVSVVANNGQTGALFFFLSGILQWSVPTAHGPNSTSMDARAQFITAADGYPDGSPGTFYFFDSAGRLLWKYGTENMCWPMHVSADGNAIAAGSDDSNVYYF